MAADPEALKRRFKIFALADGASALVAAAGFVGEFGFERPEFRPVWILGVVGMVAAMTWFVLQMRKPEGDN